MTQQILVVDDDPKIVRLVRSYLEQSGFQVLTAYDGETALHIIRRERPALVVLDLMLPDRDGWEIIRIVRNDPTLAELPVIMLTARVEDTDKIIGLELGADDYITKPFNPREVVARVRALLRRATPPSSATAIFQFNALGLDVERHSVTLNHQTLDVTPMEFDILALLIKHQGRAFSRTELIEQALGYTYMGPERSIDTHIKNLRKKIEVDPARPEYIQTVYGIGYRLGDPV